jgi:adenylate cyclase
LRSVTAAIVKTTDDGLLAEFASVVDAVRCAAEVQRGMLDREPEVADERRIRFRIGINLGDVIAEDDDIFGDGVNVACQCFSPGGQTTTSPARISLLTPPWHCTQPQPDVTTSRWPSG